MPTPDPGLAPDARLRAELVALLRGGNAHADPRTILADIPPERVNRHPDGLPYSLWQLVEHLRFTQRDILDFVRDPDYAAPEWPDAYWPGHEATPEEWERSRAAFLTDLDDVVALVEGPGAAFFSEFDHAPGYTLFREVLLVADHNAHHLGEVVVLRRLLGIWEPQT
ncbi:MAG: DinB family protein [Rhodothermales bacterium]|nr:DinB family protein [Rhodothermales bacterium]